MFNLDCSGMFPESKNAIIMFLFRLRNASIWSSFTGRPFPHPIPPPRNSLTGQDSTIHFVRFDHGGAVSEQKVRYALLPVSSLVFLSEKAVVGGGHDMNPLVFSANSSGQW